MKIFIASVGSHVFELDEADCRRAIYLGSIRTQILERMTKNPKAVVVLSEFLPRLFGRGTGRGSDATLRYS